MFKKILGFILITGSLLFGAYGIIMKDTDIAIAGMLAVQATVALFSELDTDGGAV